MKCKEVYSLIKNKSENDIKTYVDEIYEKILHLKTEAKSSKINPHKK